MHRSSLLLLFALAGICVPASAMTPAEAAVAALADVKRLPIDTQQNVAYLWAGAVKDQAAFYKVLNFHINSLSRESDLIPPAQVQPDLWRVDLRDYGWKKEVWNKLAGVDPYFHIKAQLVLTVGTVVQTTTSCQACVWDQQEKIWGTVDAGTRFTVRGISGDRVLFDSDLGALGIPRSAVQITKEQDKITAAAPWLPAATIAELILLTQNEAPLLRADWFFAQTARQIDLNNQAVVGYYDFLDIKKEADIEELGGLDRKVAAKRRTELRAIIVESGVTLHNRQLAALQSGYWESLDVDRNDGAANAARQLDNDFKQIAKEVYFRLPNNLWGLAAVDVAGGGKLADSVPDKIASDGRSTSNDRRIHPGLSCVRCHVEGLRPYDDWARQFYANPPGDAKLTAVDYKQFQRLRQLYLRPMDDVYEDDQRVYSRTLKRLTGFTPKQAADAYAAAWREYAETAVTGEQLARELGVSYEAMTAALKRYVAPGGSQDPIVVGYLKRPEFTARREYIEEAFILFATAMQQGDRK